MNTERGLQNPRLELNRSGKPTSTQEGGILFSLQQNLRQRWQNIGRGTAIAFTFAASLVGSTPAKAGPSEDGNGPGCLTAEGFQLGFKTLADQVPCVIGAPLEAEHWGANGDSLQLTTNGMAAWRKADNWTAFTNGSRTWVNGPFGVQDRDNGARFPFEDGGQTVEQETGYPFPKQIGNLNQDHVVSYNKGTVIGVTDNREDPQNNWQAVAAVAKRYAPNDRFEIFFYDNPNEVPIPPSPQKYNVDVRWSGTYPGAQDGKQLRIQTPEGIWQWHTSLPINMRPNDVNDFSRNETTSLLRFFISKDDVSTTWKDDFSAILRQQALDPYNSGKMNFSLKVVTVPSAGN